VRISTGSRESLRAQAPEDVEPRPLRQAEVEDQEIELIGGERAVGLGAVLHRSTA
jgi:hypothetical protein